MILWMVFTSKLENWHHRSCNCRLCALQRMWQVGYLKWTHIFPLTQKLRFGSYLLLGTGQAVFEPFHLSHSCCLLGNQKEGHLYWGTRTKAPSIHFCCLSPCHRRASRHWELRWYRRGQRWGWLVSWWSRLENFLQVQERPWALAEIFYNSLQVFRLSLMTCGSLLLICLLLILLKIFYLLEERNVLYQSIT